MSYVAGTRTLQANPAEDFYAQISTLLTAHANWTFIEDYTLATYKWSVWKCGTLNSTGVAFYVLFHRAVAAGSTLLGFGICEDYDAVAHSVTRAGPIASSTARTPNADGSLQGATVTVLPNGVGVSPQISVAASLTVATSAYDYWIAANNDGMWIGSRVGVGSVQGCVLGTFDSLVDTPATNDPRPLFVGGDANAASGAPNGYTTRHPLVTTSQGYLWGTMEWFTSTYNWPAAALSGSVGTSTGDLFQGGKAVGCRMVVRNWSQSRGIAINLAGNNRGLYRHILYFTVAAGVTVGDTITLGATTWTYTGKGVFYETSAA